MKGSKLSTKYASIAANLRRHPERKPALARRLAQSGGGCEFVPILCGAHSSWGAPASCGPFDASCGKHSVSIIKRAFGRMPNAARWKRALPKSTVGDREWNRLIFRERKKDEVTYTSAGCAEVVAVADRARRGDIVRFFHSALHQRRKPWAICLRKRKSGTKPS